jgi:hypothetical protein
MGMHGACWNDPSYLPTLLLLWLSSWTCNYKCVYVCVCYYLNFELINIHSFGLSRFYQFCVMLLLDYTFVCANNVRPSKTNIFRLIPNICLQPHNFVKGRGGRVNVPSNLVWIYEWTWQAGVLLFIPHNLIQAEYLYLNWQTFLAWWCYICL